MHSGVLQGFFYAFFISAAVCWGQEVIEPIARAGDETMNIARNKAVHICVFLTLLSCLAVSTAVAENSQPGAAQVSQSSPAATVPTRHLSHKQAAHLIYTASTPEDHRALAQYFRQEAQRKRDKEQYFMGTATTYRLHPPRVDMYRNVSTSNYYSHVADEARDTALADDQLAIFQEKLAQGLAQPK